MTVNDSLHPDNVDSTSSGEVDAALTRLWADRGPRRPATCRAQSGSA
jgi:hypothetical protein